MNERMNEWMNQAQQETRPPLIMSNSWNMNRIYWTYTSKLRRDWTPQMNLFTSRNLLIFAARISSRFHFSSPPPPYWPSCCCWERRWQVTNFWSTKQIHQLTMFLTEQQINYEAPVINTSTASYSALPCISHQSFIGIGLQCKSQKSITVIKA